MIAPHLVAEEKWWNVQRLVKRSTFSFSPFSPLALCLWKQEMTSYRCKVRLFLFNAILALAAFYFFRRHNKYCEPGSEFHILQLYFLGVSLSVRTVRVHIRTEAQLQMFEGSWIWLSDWTSKDDFTHLRPKMIFVVLNWILKLCNKWGKCSKIVNSSYTKFFAYKGLDKEVTWLTDWQQQLPFNA